jgi:hypothetical protein
MLLSIVWDTMNDPVVKRCACGVGFSAADWQRLPLVGRMDDGEGGELELRNCPCRSSISMPVPKSA